MAKVFAGAGVRENRLRLDMAAKELIAGLPGAEPRRPVRRLPEERITAATFSECSIHPPLKRGGASPHKRFHRCRGVQMGDVDVGSDRNR